MEALAPTNPARRKMSNKAVLKVTVTFKREVKRHADMEGDKTATLGACSTSRVSTYRRTGCKD